jgi:hypothetical protein
LQGQIPGKCRALVGASPTYDSPKWFSIQQGCGRFTLDFTSVDYTICHTCSVLGLYAASAISKLNPSQTRATKNIFAKISMMCMLQNLEEPLECLLSHCGCYCFRACSHLMIIATALPTVDVEKELQRDKPASSPLQALSQDNIHSSIQIKVSGRWRPCTDLKDKAAPSGTVGSHYQINGIKHPSNQSFQLPFDSHHSILLHAYSN